MAFCTHTVGGGGFAGARHGSIEIESWTIAPGSAGPQSFYASGEERDSWRPNKSVTNRHGGVRDTIVANAVAGLIVAAAAAGLGVMVSKWVTNRWDRIESQRERDLAVATDFYRAYGDFFASWKAWDAYSRERHGRDPFTKGPAERLYLLSWVARAEGALESFLVKICVERTLDSDDLRSLWCFRAGYKQLRYGVRDDAPLLWWRTYKEERRRGFREYQAFKGLAVYLAAMLFPSSRKARSSQSGNGASQSRSRHRAGLRR